MINEKSILALIPARGGSKRLPRKNVKEFIGKPLISWTIEAALNSEYIDHVVVSTEDDEISDIARQCGADVPFMRPDEIATDEATTIDVTLNAISKLKKMGKIYDLVILLQPTSPLRTTENINESIELLNSSNSDCVISVCEAEHSPLWSNTLPKSKSLINFLKKEILNKRSQDLDQYYRLNGSIYLCRINRLTSENTFFIKDKIIAYEMTQKSSIDIDTHLDFLYAEVVYNQLFGS